MIGESLEVIETNTNKLSTRTVMEFLLPHGT